MSVQRTVRGVGVGVRVIRRAGAMVACVPIEGSTVGRRHGAVRSGFISCGRDRGLVQ